MKLNPIRIAAARGRKKEASGTKQVESNREPQLPTASPTPEELASIWDSGWRPNVVFCVTANERILFTFDAKHGLWQLPQGGIEPGENVIEAAAWELSEELGVDFAKQCSKDLRFLFAEKLAFASKQSVTVNPKDRAKFKQRINGKVYFCYQVQSRSDEISVEKTEFDKVQWCSSSEAALLAGKIYQRGKKSMTLKVIEALQLDGQLS